MGDEGSRVGVLPLCSCGHARTVLQEGLGQAGVVIGSSAEGGILGDGNQCNLPSRGGPGPPLLRELIKQHHGEVWGPTPQNPKPLLRQIQWTRLAELVWMPRVSARDLDSEIKFFKHISKTLVVCPILGWRNFYYNHK